MKIKIQLLLAGLLICQLSFAQDFITRDGSKLMFKGNEILLRGMAFGNLVWDDNFSPSQHHSEIDYQRLEDLGMNAIRFYLNYKTFEDDNNPYTYKQSGWDWIDQNIQWAKDHGIYLILNMHVPQGGFQSRCEGDALWEEDENQDRLVALWKAIAEKYKNEPQIAGFDILNEPIPTQSTQSWTDLAQRIIDGIREVDTKHLIITERAIALDCDFAYSDQYNNYPQIEEENLMFTVHLYDPFEFTHQNLSWAGTGDGGSYPDESEFTLPGDLGYATGDYNNPSVPSGTSDWAYYEGSPFTVTSEDYLVGRVVFNSNGIGEGTVYFDDFELVELDENDNVIRTIFDESLSNGNFWWWSENEDGSHSSSNSGHNDNYSVTVTGNTGPATVIAHEYTFRVYPGRKYAVNGWMKGENIPATATAGITTEYYSSPSGQKLGFRDYNYLVDKITAYSKYIEEHNYPVYFGEFGAARTCFENDKGGDRWISDVLKIFDSLGYHFTYHSYKEGSFGYYDGWEKPVDPSTVNEDLKKIFTDFFESSLTPTLKPGIPANNSLFDIYPNPVTSTINIKTRESSAIEKITISTPTGEKMKEISGFTGSIDITKLSPGLYFISVKSDGSTLTRRFIKSE